MFVYHVSKSGQPIYNFQYGDELFDRMLAIGVRPFVEFGFCPVDLATKKETVFWRKGNGIPPKDYARWGELIDRVEVHQRELLDPPWQSAAMPPAVLLRRSRLPGHHKRPADPREPDRAGEDRDLAGSWIHLRR
jgi:hypothetical protein